MISANSLQKHQFIISILILQFYSNAKDFEISCFETKCREKYFIILTKLDGRTLNLRDLAGAMRA